MKRNYSTSVLLHILFLLLLFMYPLMQKSTPEPVQHAIIVDFSHLENELSPAPKSKKSAASATKPKASTPKKQPSKPKASVSKPAKAEVKPQENVVKESKVVAAKSVKKEKEKPKGPTPEEIAAAKKLKEKEAKKSKFSALLSKSKKKDKGAGESEGDDSSKGESDSGVNESNGHSNIRGVLGNRKVLKVPVIKDDSQKKGRVVVKICVDARGDVTSSTYTMMGSTTSDTYLIQLAEKGAKGYKFSPSTNLKECGKVVIDFLLK